MAKEDSLKTTAIPDGSVNDACRMEHSTLFDSELISAVELIIPEAFPNGLRKGSQIARKKFNTLFKELSGHDLPENISLDELALTIGIEYEDKVYVPSKETKILIHDEIINARNNGCGVVFYEEFYNTFVVQLSADCISSAELLKRVMEQILPDMKFYKTYACFSKENSLVKDIIGAYGKDTFLDCYEIKRRLPYADLYQIRLTCSRNEKFVSMGNEVYALADKIHISEKDIENACKLFKQVFHKAAYCVGCGVCVANCRNGSISFSDGLKITRCLHCKQCHDIDDGCLVYHSIQLPKNGGRVMKSINTFADHAPKNEWVQNFFEEGESFLSDNTLGPMQISMFRRFLSDAKLIEKNRTTAFFDLIFKLGWESEEAWGLILIQLAYYNPQIKWYIDNMPIDEIFPRQYIEDKLIENEISSKDAKSIVKAFKRLSEIPLGYVINFGTTEDSGRQIASLHRCKSTMSNELVVLYSLYRYAEACEGYYQFSLSTLMDLDIDSTGISPVKIFGFEKDEMEAMLRGLSAKYNDFIEADFTHDLDKIALRDYHTAQDVLDLF